MKTIQRAASRSDQCLMHSIGDRHCVTIFVFRGKFPNMAMLGADCRVTSASAPMVIISRVGCKQGGHHQRVRHNGHRAFLRLTTVSSR